MNSTSESLLLRLQRATDDQAWSRFAQLYTPLLFYWAKGSGLQSADAADLVQEVMGIVFQKLPNFEYDKSRSFRGWLRTVTLNKFREWCRKKSISAKGVSQSAWLQLADNQSIESTWDVQYQQQLVSRALELAEPDFLPDTWKALREFILGTRPAAEIAEKHGLSVWTIYSAKSRLMAKLRSNLDGLLD